MHSERFGGYCGGSAATMPMIAISPIGMPIMQAGEQNH
jgi:hypothetical protein